MALGLALVLRIHKAYDSVDEEVIQRYDAHDLHSPATLGTAPKKSQQRADNS